MQLPYWNSSWRTITGPLLTGASPVNSVPAHVESMVTTPSATRSTSTLYMACDGPLRNGMCTYPASPIRINGGTSGQSSSHGSYPSSGMSSHGSISGPFSHSGTASRGRDGHGTAATGDAVAGGVVLLDDVLELDDE